MKVLVVLSAVVALAAAQFLPYSGYNWAGYNGYNWAGYNGYNAGAYGLNLRSYAPAQYNYGYAPYNHGSQYHAQDLFGGYQYGYTDGLSAKSENRRADGTTEGFYSYVDANGETQRVSYTAGANGFQVEGTNLPVAPAAVRAAPLAGPEPVRDTPEVEAARAEFMRAFHEAASRQRRSAPQPVSETAEVRAARAEFERLYAASAAAAASGATPVASYLADTPEVAAEKARFQAAFNSAQTRAALPGYTGLPYAATPFATPYAGYNGFYGFNGFNNFNGFNRFFY